jgi:hypothetical protein
MYQSLACPQSVYRDLRRFALAFACESGKAATEESVGGRIASSQAHPDQR